MCGCDIWGLGFAGLMVLPLLTSKAGSRWFDLLATPSAAKFLCSPSECHRVVTLTPHGAQPAQQNILGEGGRNGFITRGQPQKRKGAGFVPKRIIPEQRKSQTSRSSPRPKCAIRCKNNAAGKERGEQWRISHFWEIGKSKRGIVKKAYLVLPLPSGLCKWIIQVDFPGN